MAPPNLVSQINPAGQARHFEWSQHLLTGYTLASGHRHRNTYDTLSPLGRVTLSESVDDGMGQRFTYKERRTWVQDALGRLTAFAFDERKDIVAVRDALGQVTQTPFDANGHPKGSVDALGRSSSTVFDRRGNLTQIIDAAGNQTRIDYNALDLPVKVTDTLGNVWTTTYDERGNRTSSTSPLGHSTHYQIGAHGLPTQITDALGKTKQLQWDAAGQLLAYTDCSGRTTHFTYNGLGHLLTTTNALGQTTVNTYDALGRLLGVTEPAAGNNNNNRNTQATQTAQHRYSWDGEGRLLAYTDPLNQSTHYRYNSSGDPIQRIDAHGKALHYHYDAAGRLIALVNENAATYQFRYDVVDNLTDEIGFDGRHQRYCYNAAGELTHVIETGGSDLGPGKVTHFERDVLGRLVAKRCEGERSEAESSKGDADTTFSYDPLGRLTAAINPAAHLRFGYDAIGQIISETQVIGSQTGATQSQQTFTKTLSHSYDALGNRLQTLLPDGRSLNWLFYGSGHLHQINLDGDILADFERDALHRETSRSQGRLSSQFDYDPAGRLVRHRVSASNAANRATVKSSNPILERAYAYDATGQLVARADRLRGRQDFKYDPVGRILSALPSAFAGKASTHQSELFAFDPAGNLLPENNIKNNSSSGNEYAGYSQNSIIPDNRLRVYQDLAFDYDAHGNVTQRIRGNQAAGTHSDAAFTWNADHQLAQATVSRHGVTQTTRYAYDALGRRVSKLDSFGATHYLWDGDLMVHSQRGSKEALFVFEPNSFVPLATVQGAANDAKSLQTYWYQCDQIGAPQELTDAQGNIVWAADYKVWGEAKVRQITLPQSYRTGTDDYSANDFTPKRGGTWKDAASSATASNAPPLIEQPFRFQGQQFDEETGLHYNRFRYYDPVIGRFVSQDPIGLAGGFNTFAYAPNPMGWVDVLGLSAKCYAILGEITNKTALLKKELLKYNPKDDAVGGYPISASKGGGTTKPGGHYEKIRGFQRGLKNSLVQYQKNDCACKCSPMKTNPIISTAERAANQTIQVPPGIAFIPIGSN
jgi:RHS repeat-associated protein